MLYNAHFTLNPGAIATPDVHTFRLNSIFDFDKSATGHFPTGYSMLAKMYRQYRVTKVTATMQPIYDSFSSTMPGMYGMIVQHVDATTTGMQWDEIMQSEMVTRPINTGGILQLPVGNQPVTIEWSGVKDIGKEYLTDDNYAGTVGYNPSTVIFLDCFYINPATVDVGLVPFNVFAEIEVTWNDLQPQLDDV